MTNSSFLDTATNPMDILDLTVKATEGVYPLGVLVSIFVVGFIALRRSGKDIDEILIYLGAFEFILAGYFVIMEWIAYYYMMLPVGLLFAGLIFNRLSR